MSAMNSNSSNSGCSISGVVSEPSNAATPPFWHKPNTTGQFPCPRCAHTTFFFDNKLFVLGGWNGHRMLNDLYALCMPQMRWVKVSTTGDPPSPRTGHATIVVGSRLVLFGGDDGVGYLNDLYILDLKTFCWSRGFSTGTTPCARSRHTMVAIDDEHLVIFGGGDDTRVYNDLYLFDTSKMFWSKIAPTYSINVPVKGIASSSLAVSAAGGFSRSAHVPAPRWGHAAVSIGPGKFIVFGGHDGSSMLNDVWLFDAMVCCWTQIHPRDAAEGPSPRAGHVMGAVGDTIIIFGGGDNEQVLNDIYLLVPMKQQPSSPLQEGASSTTVASMLKSSQQLMYHWVKGPFNKDAGPQPRCAHSICSVPMSAVSHSFEPFESDEISVATSSALVVFGGGDSTRRLKDIFFLDVPHLIHLVSQRPEPTLSSSGAGCVGTEAESAGSGIGQSSSTSSSSLLSSSSGSTTASSSSVSSSSSSTSGTTPTPAGVTAMNAFLKSVGFEAYAPVFAREEVTIETLPLLSERHLEALGVASLGVRLRLLAAIRKRYGHTSSLQQSRQPAPSSSSSYGALTTIAPSSSSAVTASEASLQQQNIAALTAATRQLQQSTEALTKAVNVLTLMMQKQHICSPLDDTQGQQVEDAILEQKDVTEEKIETNNSSERDDNDSKMLASGHDADDENEEGMKDHDDHEDHDQDHSAPEGPDANNGQMQQQHPKKKSRRNKSKQKGSGVSLAPQQKTDSPIGSSSVSSSSVTGPPSQTDGDQLNQSPRVHQSDSRLVLQQPMPNPFVRNATHPYAPLLHTSPSQTHKTYTEEDL